MPSLLEEGGPLAVGDLGSENPPSYGHLLSVKEEFCVT